jgi:hypothetical protein
MPDVNEFELSTHPEEPTDAAMDKMVATLPLLADTLRMFVEIAKGYRSQLIDTWPRDVADSLSADLLHTLIHKFLGGQHDD